MPGSPQHRLYRLGSRLAAAFVVSGVMFCAPPVSAKTPLTVRAMVETTRAMTDRNGEAVVVSPDGRRFAIMLITGDIARDGVWAELRVGRRDTRVVAPPETVARLFTPARGDSYLSGGRGSSDLVWPERNFPRWLDDEHLGLLWEDAQSVRQVVSVEVGTHEVRYLTHHPSDVLHFSVRPDGTLIYGARVPCMSAPTAAQQAQGYVVHAQDAFELLYGCSAWMRQQQALYVISPGHPQARAVVMQQGDPVSRWPPLFPAVLFSPDGQQALFPNTVSARPASWAAYTQPHFRAMWRARQVEGEHGTYTAQIQQLFVIDVASARARPLWNAPNEPFSRLRAAWSPDGSTVLLGPTFLPAESSDAAGLAAEAVAAVNVRDGHFEVLPLPASQATRIRQLRWRSGSRVDIQLDDGCVAYRHAARRWQPVTGREADCQVPANDTGLHGHWSIELEQSLNDPPRFVAVDRVSGERQVVLDPNDDLARRFSLGRVDWIEREVGAHRWEGRLYYPVDYQPGRRYPLVIQTHSVAGRHEFSLTSRGGHNPALGPASSAYIAQPLANQGFFVLHGDASDVMAYRDGVGEVQIRIATVEAVVDALAAEGLVDRAHVGIMGFSATGWEVAYAISHSKFPYAAALMDDNKDGGYLQAAFANWSYGAAEQLIGAPAFGDGLKVWLEHSPAFNAHRIETPLLMTVTSDASMMGRWELFSRLRQLGKPVEFYVIPDLAHGTHGLQNPTQILALQERTLDWWRFWLKREEDPAPGKAAQYEGWRALRERQRKQSREPHDRE